MADAELLKTAFTQESHFSWWWCQLVPLELAVTGPSRSPMRQNLLSCHLFMGLVLLPADLSLSFSLDLCVSLLGPTFQSLSFLKM